MNIRCEKEDDSGNFYKEYIEIALKNKIEIDKNGNYSKSHILDRDF